MEKDRTREEWRELIELHAQSRQPASSWCKAQGISVSRFYTARRRIQGGAQTSPIHWTPVRVVDEAPVAAAAAAPTTTPPAAASPSLASTPVSMLILELGDRYRLHIPSDMDASRLRQILEVLVP